MKNLILASLLGSAATAFAVPALSGPVHFAITRPYSLFGWIPANNGGSNPPVSVTLGTAPLDFILTDVMLSNSNAFGDVVVTVNGTPVFNVGTGDNPAAWPQGSTHMTSGIFIGAGSTIGLQARSLGSPASPVTLAGYVQ